MPAPLAPVIVIARDEGGRVVPAGIDGCELAHGTRVLLYRLLLGCSGGRGPAKGSQRSAPSKARLKSLSPASGGDNLRSCEVLAGPPSHD